VNVRQGRIVHPSLAASFGADGPAPAEAVAVT